MKGLLILLFTALVGLSSCYFDEGPRGPRGYDGRDGIDGVAGEEGFVFEYEFSFTAPNYSELLLLPDDFVMLDTDVMLVYFLWEITEDGVEIWRSLPQTMYFNDGVLEYNYDFTKYDASVFLDGNINFDGLGAVYTDNWIARVVVVPAQYGGRGEIDYSNYDEVKGYFGLSKSKLAKNGYTRRPQE